MLQINFIKTNKEEVIKRLEIKNFAGAVNCRQSYRT